MLQTVAQIHILQILDIQDPVSHYVNINGVRIDSTLSKGTDNNFVITFGTAPQAGQEIHYGLFIQHQILLVQLV